MKIKLIVIYFISSVLLYSQVEENYRLKDSVIVISKKVTEDVEKQKINLNEFILTSGIGYDLMSSLKVLGISSLFDFSCLPYLEGADFQEQQFFINNFPIPFQSRLIGLQSGLNSLLFSNISLLETQSINNYSKPIKLQVSSKLIDKSNINYESNFNILHFENKISFPLSKLNGGIIIGYNRSLLETINPFLGNLNSENNFEYKKFPFYQGFQLMAEFGMNNLIIKPMFIYNNDVGNFGMMKKGFNFLTHQFNIGADIQTKFYKIINSTQLYFNSGVNSIAYLFPSTQNNNIDGNANLSFSEYGLTNNIEFFIQKNQLINFSFSYKHQLGNSQNVLNSSAEGEKKKAAFYSSNFIKSNLYYKYIYSSEVLSTFNIGFNNSGYNIFYPTFGIDLYYNYHENFDIRLQMCYELTQDIMNPIFFTFQNAIWESSAVSSLFFVDNSKLPINPIKFFTTSLNISNKISISNLETVISVKLFYRQLQNLIYGNNYPEEITIENSDYEFNQNFDGKRYGVSFIVRNEVNSISLKNIFAVNLFASFNRDQITNNTFNALNYNPLTITNLSQYQLNNFFVNALLTFSSGRYLFNKIIKTEYSSKDSLINYSLFTDYLHQSNLNPYVSCDISLQYKYISTNYTIDVGISCLNIFNNKNESKRSYFLNSMNNKIETRNEYYNFPRFLIFGIILKMQL